MQPHLFRLAVGALLVLGESSLARAQGPTDLARATLEELLNVQVSSIARKDQRADEAAAAVYVLTRDDIRRSGLTTLPELFRLVPGMQVAQINANMWAVSVRGFNDLFSNKLLVLVDGRSIYQRAFSGVFWPTEDLSIDDIERIEVLRGPGGTSWGANAVNGVINIVTKSAADTKGLSVDLAAGTFSRDKAAVRYGGSIGQTDYRVYAQQSDSAAGQTANGASADDQGRATTVGLRMDRTAGRDSFMLQSGYTKSVTRPHWAYTTTPFGPPASQIAAFEQPNDIQSGHVVGRWSRRFTGSLLQVQSFWEMNSDVAFRYLSETVDVDAQYQVGIGRHDFVMGGGVRGSDFENNSEAVSMAGEKGTVSNAYLQDEIKFGAARLMVGARLEHDTVAGWGVLPSVRAIWDVTPRQNVWAAASRARRTPSVMDRSIQSTVSFTPGPPLPTLVVFDGNPSYRTEELMGVDAGYRLHFGAHAAVDASVFHGAYEYLQTIEPLAPVVVTTPTPPHVLVTMERQNLLNATTSGVEVAAHWAPFRSFRVDGWYAAFRVTPDLNPASRDASAAAFDANAPAHQWQIRSSVWVSPRVEIDGGVSYTGRLAQSGADAYTRVDLRTEFQATSQLSIIVTGQNLLDPSHLEFPAATSVARTYVPRSVNVRLAWRF